MENFYRTAPLENFCGSKTRNYERWPKGPEIFGVFGKFDKFLQFSYVHFVILSVINSQVCKYSKALIPQIVRVIYVTFYSNYIVTTGSGRNYSGNSGSGRKLPKTPAPAPVPVETAPESPAPAGGKNSASGRSLIAISSTFHKLHQIFRGHARMFRLWH